MPIAPDDVSSALASFYDYSFVSSNLSRGVWRDRRIECCEVFSMDGARILVSAMTDITPKLEGLCEGLYCARVRDSEQQELQLWFVKQ
jgi:hypothetical protein